MISQISIRSSTGILNNPREKDETSRSIECGTARASVGKSREVLRIGCPGGQGDACAAVRRSQPALCERFFAVDHLEGILVHLENHDVTYVAVARAPIEEIEVVRKRFRWVSSYNSDFNYDFNVSFRAEEVAAGRAYYNYRYTNPGLEDLSGHSVFFKNDSGQIFHTYSTYARGDEVSRGL